METKKLSNCSICFPEKIHTCWSCNLEIDKNKMSTNNEFMCKECEEINNNFTDEGDE